MLNTQKVVITLLDLITPLEMQQKFLLKVLLRDMLISLSSILDGVSLANKGADFEVLGNEAVVTNGEGKTKGVEFLFQQKLTRNFYGIFSYTFFKSEFTDINGDYLPSVWDSKHLSSFSGGYKLKRKLGNKLQMALCRKNPLSFHMI